MYNDYFFPETEKINLSEGADLYCHTTDEYKASRMDIFFTLPSDKIRSPLMRLTLSLLFNGSVNFPTLTIINKHLDNMYDSTISTRDYRLGANHVFKISCTTLDKKFLPENDKSLDLMGENLKVVEDIFLNPILESDGYVSKDFFKKELRIAIDNINARNNNPKAYTSIKCGEMLYGDDPAGIEVEGDEKILRGFTRKDATLAIDYFLKKANIKIFYIGSDTKENIAQKLFPIFKRIGDREPCDIVEQYPVTPPEYAEKTESFNINQGRLHLGLTLGRVFGSEESGAMSLYNDILGGSSTSKLFLNVREKKSLCYYCHSGIDTSSGVMMIACGIKCENRDVALEEIKNQIEQMRLGNISDEEIEVSKKGIINGISQIPDTTSSIINTCFRYKTLANADFSIEKRKADILATTKEDIVAFAQNVTLCSVFFLDANTDMTKGEGYENN